MAKQSKKQKQEFDEDTPDFIKYAFHDVTYWEALRLQNPNFQVHTPDDFAIMIAKGKYRELFEQIGTILKGKPTISVYHYLYVRILETLEFYILQCDLTRIIQGVELYQDIKGYKCLLRLKRASSPANESRQSG